MPDDDINGRVTTALLVQQLAYISAQLEKLTIQVEAMCLGGKERDTALIKIGLLLRDYKDVERRVDFMYPWVVGVRWFCIIAGGVIAVAIIGGVFWAVAQSGGLLP